MSVNIELSPFFGMFTKDILSIKVEANTVSEALQSLVRQFPELEKVLLNEQGCLQKTYEYFINSQNVYPQKMSQPLKDGDILSILYIIHGG